MQVPGLTGAFGEHVNVDVDETIPDRRQIRDPGLFGHLPAAAARSPASSGST